MESTKNLGHSVLICDEWYTNVMKKGALGSFIC